MSAHCGFIFRYSGGAHCVVPIFQVHLYYCKEVRGKCIKSWFVMGAYYKYLYLFDVVLIIWGKTLLHSCCTGFNLQRHPDPEYQIMILDKNCGPETLTKTFVQVQLWFYWTRYCTFLEHKRTSKMFFLLQTINKEHKCANNTMLHTENFLKGLKPTSYWDDHCFFKRCTMSIKLPVLIFEDFAR